MISSKGATSLGSMGALPCLPTASRGGFARNLQTKQPPCASDQILVSHITLGGSVRRIQTCGAPSLKIVAWAAVWMLSGAAPDCWCRCWGSGSPCPAALAVIDQPKYSSIQCGPSGCSALFSRHSRRPCLADCGAAPFRHPLETPSAVTIALLAWPCSQRGSASRHFYLGRTKGNGGVSYSPSA